MTIAGFSLFFEVRFYFTTSWSSDSEVTVRATQSQTRFDLEDTVLHSVHEHWHRGSIANPDCERFVRARITTEAGIGHRMSEVVLALWAADKLAATYLYDADVMTKAGNHGSFPWFNDFLNLHTVAVSTNSTRSKGLRVAYVKPLTEKSIHAKRNNGQCKIIIEVGVASCKWQRKLKNGNMHEERWCHHDPMLYGVYSQVRGMLSEIFWEREGRQSPLHYPTQFVSEPSRANVVIHLRTGDVALHGKDIGFFGTILSQVAKVLSGIPHRLFFISHQPFTLMDQILTLCNDLTLECTVDVSDNSEHHMYMMVHGDMLISTGSSFAYVAALVNEDTVHIAAPPKEYEQGLAEPIGPHDNWHSMYRMDNWIITTISGETIGTPLLEVRARLLSRIHRANIERQSSSLYRM
jgi:hypothetical protein